MAWGFDPSAVDIVWTVSIEYTEQAQIGSIDMGLNGDLGIDTGSRENANTVMDQGLRVL
jgi:hypothetical protein